MGLFPPSVTSIQILPGPGIPARLPGGIVPTWPPASYTVEDIFSDIYSDIFGVPEITTTVVILPGPSPTG